MVVTIDRAADEAVYEQVARQVRDLIAAGRLRAGRALPSVRTLASDLGVNLNTVARAYRQLEAEGFVLIRDREGAEVAPPAAHAERADVARLTAELRAVLARLRQGGMSTTELGRLAGREIDALH